ncbi:MAG TPA: hypothetical protein VNA11_02430, partial [Pseudonocardia sp.]|nr:hypothetical protein [Pseudonocardia sp.]
MAELTPLEEELASAYGTGQPLDVTGRPDREVRAGVVRDLLAEGRGLRLTGAVVAGALDLEGMRLGGALRLVECEFTGPLTLRGADVPLLDLRRSRLVSLSA